MKGLSLYIGLHDSSAPRERDVVMSVVQAVRERRSRSRDRSKGIAREVVMHIVCFATGAVVSSGATLGELSPFGASLTAAVSLSEDEVREVFS